MPMLKKVGVPPLLSNFHKKSSPRPSRKTQNRSRSVPDIDPDADPLSTSDSDNADIELSPDAPTNTDLRAGREYWNTASPAQRQTLSRRQDGGARSGQKRKRPTPAATVGVVKDENEVEAIFDGARSRGEKRKNKKLYSRRHQSPATLNLHASPQSGNKPVLLSKPISLTASTHVVTVEHPTWMETKKQVAKVSLGSDKNAFHAPMPLQDLKSAVRAGSRPASLTSSHRSSLQASGSSQASTEPSSILSSPLASETLDSTHEHFDQQLATLEALDSPPNSPDASSNKPAGARCPMCKTEVDLDYLLSFSKGNKLRLTEAMDFCREHKQRSVQLDWKLPTYPPINWGSLDKRLRRFNGKLHAILDRRTTSVYWKELEDHIASGRSRNALRNPEAENVQRLRGLTGYYGGKGARKMMEHIMARFAAKIRALAAKERLFTEVGVSGFVQAVLVPELVVMLVMEDYGGCNASRARQIVTESADTGDLMNDEEEERIEEKVDQDEKTLLPVMQGTTMKEQGDGSFILIE